MMPSLLLSWKISIIILCFMAVTQKQNRINRIFYFLRVFKFLKKRLYQST